MDRWITFANERLRLPAFVVIVAGIAASGVSIGSKSFLWLPFFVSFIGIFLAFIIINLIGEVEDSEKDRIAHPNRPLPRGLISKHEATQAIELLKMILFAYSFVIWVAVGAHAALAYLLISIYVWGMKRGFGIAPFISRRPFLKGFLRFIILFPIAIFAVTVANSNAIAMPMAWSFGFMLFGTFFTFDICSKLDPHTHPILATYIHYHGFQRTFEVALLMVAFSAMSAFALNVAALLIPFEFFVVGSLSTLFFQPSLCRFPQVAAAVSLFLHVWAVALFRIFI